MGEVLKDEKLLEPNKIEPTCIEAMNKVVEHKMKLFETTDKAHLYSLDSKQFSDTSAKQVL